MEIKEEKCITRIKALIRSAHPEINLIDLKIPLTNGKPTPKLKDILETNVDEKYYLKNEVVEKIASESNFQERLVSFKVQKKAKQIPQEELNPDESLISLEEMWNSCND